MKSILFLITCSLCAFCCFAATDHTIPVLDEVQELACGKCRNNSCKGCKGLMLTCGDDEACPCGCGKKDLQKLAGCGCKGKGKGHLQIAGCGCKGKGKAVNHACSSCKKKKCSVAVPVVPSTTILSAC